MILYLLIAVFTVMLAVWVKTIAVNGGNEYRNEGISRQQACNRLCLFSIFIVLFAVSACRLNVGNDYAKYVEFMHLINCNAFVPTEFGFNQVVKLLYGISGFENYLLVFVFLLFLLFLRFCSFCTGFTGRPTLFHLASSCLWLLAIIFSPSTPCGITWLWLWRCWRFPVCLRESG